MYLSNSEIKQLVTTAQEFSDYEEATREEQREAILEHVDYLLSRIGRRPPLVMASLCILGWKIAARMVSVFISCS